jgi:hypothetical protein
MKSGGMDEKRRAVYPKFRIAAVSYDFDAARRCCRRNFLRSASALAVAGQRDQSECAKNDAKEQNDGRQTLWNRMSSDDSCFHGHAFIHERGLPIHRPFGYPHSVAGAGFVGHNRANDVSWRESRPSP